MDRDSLAAQFIGETYPFEPSQFVARQAKDAGLVIVWGNSDDLLEFRGAIHEEFGAYGGRTVTLDHQGIFPTKDEAFEREGATLLRYASRDQTGVDLTSVWCESNDGPAWTIKTSIPHATFDIMEDGECQSRGIVFRLEDVKRQAP